MRTKLLFIIRTNKPGGPQLENVFFLSKSIQLHWLRLVNNDKLDAGDIFFSFLPVLYPFLSQKLTSLGHFFKLQKEQTNKQKTPKYLEKKKQLIP